MSAETDPITIVRKYFDAKVMARQRYEIVNAQASGNYDCFDPF